MSHERESRADRGSAPQGTGSAARRAGPAAAGTPLDLLLGLVDDESPRVWSEVRPRIAAHGRRARPALRSMTRHGNARERARARRILLDQDRERAFRRMTGWVLRPILDLEDGLLLMSRLAEPAFDARPYRRALDIMGTEVRRRIDASAPGASRIRVLSEYLGGELGYAGPAEDYHHPDNVFLHRTIERKVGMPLTLSALYRSVAERAGLSAGLLPLPGHVMLRVALGPERAIIDPFHHGDVRSEEQCLAYLAQNGLPFHPTWFREATDRAMLKRQLANLKTSWTQRGLGTEVRGLKRVLAAIVRAPLDIAPEWQAI